MEKDEDKYDLEIIWRVLAFFFIFCPHIFKIIFLIDKNIQSKKKQKKRHLHSSQHSSGVNTQSNQYFSPHSSQAQVNTSIYKYWFYIPANTPVKYLSQYWCVECRL